MLCFVFLFFSFQCKYNNKCKYINSNCVLLLKNIILICNLFLLFVFGVAFKIVMRNLLREICMVDIEVFIQLLFIDFTEIFLCFYANLCRIECVCVCVSCSIWNLPIDKIMQTSKCAKCLFSNDQYFQFIFQALF